MVAVGALVKKAPDGTCEDVRVGLTHMSSVPLRATAVEAALRGQVLDPNSIAAAAEQAAEGTEPPADLNASAEYKRHLARVLTKPALTDAGGACPALRRRAPARRSPHELLRQRCAVVTCARKLRATSRPPWAVTEAKRPAGR